jgi:hypothetical protein
VFTFLEINRTRYTVAWSIFSARYEGHLWVFSPCFNVRKLSDVVKKKLGGRMERI